MLGRDVLRSLSPAIHNRAFAALGEDAVYVPLQAESLDGFLRALPALGLSGFSVTRPYKQEIVLAARLDLAGSGARRLGEHGERTGRRPVRHEHGRRRCARPAASEARPRRLHAS